MNRENRMKLRLGLTAWWIMCVMVNGAVYDYSRHVSALLLALFSFAMLVRSSVKLLRP